MVSSWYFGDGTLLFNQARRAVRDVPQLLPLDPVLTTAGTRHQRGLLFGFRVIRTFAGRFGAEFSFDAAPARLRMSDEMRAGIETSAASFQDSFSRILAVLDGFGFGDVAVDSTATIRPEGGTRLGASGTLNVDLFAGPKRAMPYVTVGAGVITTAGNLPGAMLVGTYRVAPAETNGVIEETDTVRIRYEERSSPTFIVGGGVKLNVTAKTGIRADVRVDIGTDKGRIVVDATPSEHGTPSYSASFSTSTASIVFATENARQRSLSGPAIAGFPTFTNTGNHIQTAVTLGYFLSF
jgi:hypothetical protein